MAISTFYLHVNYLFIRQVDILHDSQFFSINDTTLHGNSEGCMHLIVNQIDSIKNYNSTIYISIIVYL